MSYKNLRNFKDIFNRDDFNYICDNAHISEVSEIFLYRIAVPDGKESAYIKLLESFLTNLDYFYMWLNGDKIPNIVEGYSICKDELVRSMGILRLSADKRASISKGYRKKFKKLFLHGLSKLLKGIRSAFDPSLISTTDINKDQLVRYFLDEKEGLRNKFLFNTAGKYNAVTKLQLLNKKELIEAEKLLLNQNPKRTTRNGWIDLGSGGMPLRILLIKNKEFGIFRKYVVMFIFRLTEHPNYDRQLNTSPDRVGIQLL